MSASNEVMESYGLPSMFPLIGGHEGAGVVAEVGEGVTSFEPGDHVVIVLRRGLWPLPLVQFRHGVHLRYGRAGHDSRYADGWHLPPSHHRRSAASVTCRRSVHSPNTLWCRRIRSSRSHRICRCFRWRCCPAGSRRATARRRTAPTSRAATPLSSSVSAASAPALSREHASTVRHRSSPSTRWSSSRSPRWDSVPRTASRRPRKPPTLCAI